MADSLSARERYVVSLTLAGFVSMLHDDGVPLQGILGKAGIVADDPLFHHEIGVDLIQITPGSGFPMHTHPGSHILVITHGRICVFLDDEVLTLAEGDTIFIPADHPHNVLADPTWDGYAQFLAFGYPHLPVDSTERMRELHLDAPTHMLSLDPDRQRGEGPSH